MAAAPEIVGLDAEHVRPFVGANQAVEVTWVEWEAPADVYTPIARHTHQGSLRWAQPGQPDSPWTVVWFEGEDGVTSERLLVSDIVRIETPWDVEVGMTLADIDAAILSTKEAPMALQEPTPGSLVEIGDAADPITDPEVGEQLLSTAGGLEVLRALYQFPYIDHPRLTQPVTVGALVTELRRIAVALQEAGRRNSAVQSELDQLHMDLAAFRRIIGGRP
jgi:hypothetical protein